MSEMAAVVSSRRETGHRNFILWCRTTNVCITRRQTHVQVEGPFPSGGGAWSLDTSLKGQDEPALLLLAGGTGWLGWLPGLMRLAEQQRQCHLVWVVKTPGDYAALSLPSAGAGFKSDIFHLRGRLPDMRARGFSDEIRSRCNPCACGSGSAYAVKVTVGKWRGSL